MLEWHKEIIIKGAKYFGPYTDAGAVRKTLEYLRRIFPVRDCGKARPGKSTNMPCLNYHIKLCTAPCDGNVSQEEYRKNIDFIIKKKPQKEVLSLLKQAKNSVDGAAGTMLRAAAMESEKQKE